MTKKFLFALLLVTFIGCGLRSDKEEKKVKMRTKQSKEITQGIELLSNNQFPEAIKKFNRAIQEDPRNVDNYILLGQVYNKLGNHVGAERILTTAQSIEPDNGEVYFLLSQALGQQEGKMDQSMAAALLGYQKFGLAKDEEGIKKSVILIRAISEQARQASATQ